MTNYPITPPPELVQQCWDELRDATQALDAAKAWGRAIALAYQAGADQQLAEDAKWLDQQSLDAPHLKITPVGKSLIEAMRPKPLSLKELALASVKRFEESGEFVSDQMRELGFIRKALEALPND